MVWKKLYESRLKTPEEAIKLIKDGDRVVAANSAPCGECFYCKKEQYNLCENLQFLNGAYAQYVVIPKLIAQKNLIKIPDNLPFEYAAFTEPLANVVHGIDRVEIKKGDIVGICGLGPIGLFFAKLASKTASIPKQKPLDPISNLYSAQQIILKLNEK